MTGDNNMQGPVKGSSFTKAFLMGLIVGVIVGGFAGAFLPPFLERSRPAMTDNKGPAKPRTPRDETRDPLPPVPADGAQPEEKPEENKPETPAPSDPPKPNG